MFEPKLKHHERGRWKLEIEKQMEEEAEEDGRRRGQREQLLGGIASACD